MWGGDTENADNNLNIAGLDQIITKNKKAIGVLEDTIPDLDKEINNHKGNMIGNLIWIIVCILLLIFVNIFSTNKDVNTIINIIFSLLLFGNLIMIVVNRYKRDSTAMKKSGKISRIKLLIKQNNLFEKQRKFDETANNLQTKLLHHQNVAAKQRKETERKQKEKEEEEQKELEQKKEMKINLISSISKQIDGVNMEQDESNIVGQLYNIYMEYVSTADISLDYYTEFIVNNNKFNDNIKKGVKNKIITYLSQRYER